MVDSWRKIGIGLRIADTDQLKKCLIGPNPDPWDWLRSFLVCIQAKMQKKINKKNNNSCKLTWYQDVSCTKMIKNSLCSASMVLFTMYSCLALYLVLILLIVFTCSLHAFLHIYCISFALVFAGLFFAIGMSYMCLCSAHYAVQVLCALCLPL